MVHIADEQALWYIEQVTQSVFAELVYLLSTYRTGNYGTSQLQCFVVSKVKAHLSLYSQDWGDGARDGEYKYMSEQKT